MQISSAIAQLRTTNLAESIRFYTTKVGLTLEFQHEGLLCWNSSRKSAFSPQALRQERPLHRVRRERRALPPLL